MRRSSRRLRTPSSTKTRTSSAGSGSIRPLLLTARSSTSTLAARRRAGTDKAESRVRRSPARPGLFHFGLLETAAVGREWPRFGLRNRADRQRDRSSSRGLALADRCPLRQRRHRERRLPDPPGGDGGAAGPGEHLGHPLGGFRRAPPRALFRGGFEPL